MTRMEERIAERYRAEGFDVIVDPEPAQMPFPMQNYRPDLIATKGREKFIVEVKSRYATIPIERFQEISRQVSEHPGWKLVIVNLSDEDSFVPELPRIQVDVLAEAVSLANSDTPKYGVIPAWNAYEAHLRSRFPDVPDYSSVGSLLNSLVSLGLISNEHYEAAKRLNQIRNQVVHGVGPELGREDVLAFIATTEGLMGADIPPRGLPRW